MLLELLISLIYVSGFLTIAAFYLSEQPIPSIVSGIFWFALSFSISSIRIYNAPSADPTPITYLPEDGMMYLFGGMGVIMILNAIYILVSSHIEDEVDMAGGGGM